MQESTSESLLKRVRDGGDAASWREFNALYSPLLVRYARCRGLRRSDAQDIAQECMGILVKVMPQFDYDRRRGRFKSYLRTLANNAIANRFRRRRPRLARTGELTGMANDDPTAQAAWETAWRREHLAYCLKRVETRFSSETLEAFRQHVLNERPVAEVCASLNMTANQVYLAKSRVTRRLRIEMEALVGEVE